MIRLYDFLCKIKVFRATVDNIRLQTQLDLLKKERDFWRNKYYNLEQSIKYDQK